MHQQKHIIIISFTFLILFSCFISSIATSAEKPAVEAAAREAKSRTISILFLKGGSALFSEKSSARESSGKLGVDATYYRSVYDNLFVYVNLGITGASCKENIYNSDLNSTYAGAGAVMRNSFGPTIDWLIGAGPAMGMTESTFTISDFEVDRSSTTGLGYQIFFGLILKPFTVELKYFNYSFNEDILGTSFDRSYSTILLNIGASLFGYYETHSKTEERQKFKQAIELYNQNKFSECIKILEDLLEDDPDNIIAQNFLEEVEAQIEYGGIEEVDKLYNEAVILYNEKKYYESLSVLEKIEVDYEPAKQLLDRVKKQITYEEALILYDKNKFIECVDLLKDLTDESAKALLKSAKEKGTVFYYNEAEKLRREESYNRAIEYYKKALSLNPEYKEAALKLIKAKAAKIYLQAKDEVSDENYIGALALLNEALKLDSEFRKAEDLYNNVNLIIKDGETAIKIVKNTKPVSDPQTTIGKLLKEDPEILKRLHEKVYGYAPWQYKIINFGWSWKRQSENVYLVSHKIQVSSPRGTETTQTIFKVNIKTKTVQPENEEAEVHFKP